MRKTTLLFMLISTFLVSIQAQSLVSRPVGPGIVYHEVGLPEGPWQIDILEIDLNDSMNTLETVKANNNIAGYERTSSMANRSNAADHRVVGAINGDFYASGGVSIGAQIIKGRLLKRPFSRSVFAMDTQKNPLIDIVSFNGQVSKQDSLNLIIHGINEVRNTDQVILYNTYMGASTGTNQWGVELELAFVTAPTGVNGIITAVITAKDSILETGHGNMTIPQDMGCVLSGHGTSRDYINEHYFIGDTLVINLNLPPTSAILSEMIGGTPRLIRNGARSVEWEAEGVGSSFTHDRHPRTAVGFNADSSKVFLFTVDGRQGGYSVGMSLMELADYMLEWGVYQGVNLDGGGSTTMVVDGDVVNSPSDGTERTVANALMVISTAPLGPLTYIFLPWEETHTLVESQLQLSVTGSDLYYSPLPVDSDSILWSCDPSIGSISETGLFTAAAMEGSGLIFANHGDIADTVLIHVTDIASLVLTPNPVILEVDDIQLMSAEARDNFGNLIQVESSSYDWYVTPEIASISQDGAITALHPGMGSIEASYHGVSATVPLQVGTSVNVILDNFNTVSAYTLSGAVINLSACNLVTDDTQFISSPSSGRLDYSLTTGGTSVLYLNCLIPISGTPESVSINVFGDNSGHWLRGEFKNSNGEKFIINFTEASPGIDWNDEWRELTVLLEDATPHWGNSTATLSFPITWTKIYLAETDDNNKDSGSLYFDDFSVDFISSGIKEAQPVRPRMFQLVAHFPNPFNATTRFRFSIHEAGLLELKLYSLDGREVDSLKQDATPGNITLHWHANNLPSGVYVFKATLGSQELSGKCLLVK